MVSNKKQMLQLILFFYKLEHVFILSEFLLSLNVIKWILLSVPPTGYPTEHFM